MSAADRRRGAALFALALLFLALMTGLYWWALQTDGRVMGSGELPSPAPPPPETPLTSRPAPRRATPVVAPGALSQRPAKRTSEPATPADEPETADDALSAAELHVRVVDDTQQPLRFVPVVVSSAGGNRARRFSTDLNGQLVQRVEPAVLTVLAERADGLLVSRSDAVEIDARGGGRWDVELIVPSEERAGLGVGIAPHEAGVVVTSVHPGTPAEEAGLTTGDVISAVEGEPTAGMPLPDFVARMTGPPGTKVLFDVLHGDGREERLQVERRRLEQ